jgi:DnaJ-class molecular chaperone
MNNYIELECEQCNGTGERSFHSDGMDGECECENCLGTGKEKMTTEGFYTFLEQRNNEYNSLLKQITELKLVISNLQK